jgi:glycosyltransferase involved in cell wall biosynthesis
MPSISAALPAFNEEANIARTIGALVPVLASLTDDYEIIVVDDGSRDRTAEVTRALAAQYPQVRLVQHKINQGYGAALYNGFTAATKDYVFMTDSDAQFDVRELTKFVPLLADADMVIGYRAPRRDPFVRRLNGWGWTSLGNLLFGYTARDVDCAFKLFRREIMDNIDVQSRGAAFSLEFMVRARRAGYRVREVPVTHLPRTAGKQTGARLDVIIRAFRELLSVRAQIKKERRAP